MNNKMRKCFREKTSCKGGLGSLMIVGATVLLALTSCVGTEPPTTAQNMREGALQGGNSASQIGGLGPGDVIAVTYNGAPELNLRQRIRSDGKLSLPLVGDVVAGGKALSKFQSELIAKYRAHLQDPSLVVARESTAAAVYVSGGVNTPTKVSLDRPMTALEAIMEAGGFSPAGNPKTVVVVRNNGQQRKRFVLDLDATLSSGGATSPFYLRPFDVITVKERVW
jgi:polysaccharide export outer membrane protein